MTSPYVGPDWNETHRPLPSLCIPEQFQIPTVINKATNTKVRSCKYNLPPEPICFNAAPRSRKMEVHQKQPPKSCNTGYSLERRTHCTDLKLLYAVALWKWLQIFCWVYLFTALSCNTHKAKTGRERSPPPLTALPKSFGALLKCAVFFKVLHSSESCLSLRPVILCLV